MFRKVLVPTVSRLAGQLTARTLSRRVLTRLPQTPSLLRNTDHQTILSLHSKIAPYACFHTHTAALSSAPVAVEDPKPANEESTEEPRKRFDSIEAINPATQRALQKIFKYTEMSVVQEAVLSRLPNENDMFVKAKTGTGKTLAFLIAAMETAFKGKSPKELQYFEGTSILVISPTRELASQIATEAEKLLKFYPCKVHCLVGGDSKHRQIMRMERNRCDVVVATPGRLNDMLSSVPRFKKMVQNLKVLVLDEADQLLDMGFKVELQRILEQIPEKRQTMLYSATLSKEIRDNLGKFALSPQHDVLDTVGDDDVNTHMHVKQSALVLPYSEQVNYIRDMFYKYKPASTGKVIVFLPTTKSTMLYAQTFKYLLPERLVYELHSRKSQDQRSRISERFRKAPPGTVLFTSDVSARGVDYPGVSLVVQVGMPTSREQYIHRLGRTGRAGREGEGVIVLAPFEKRFLKQEVADLPIQNLVPPEIDDTVKESTQKQMKHALRAIDDELVREIYTAYLGYYSSRMQTLGKPRIETLAQAKEFLTSFNIEDIPHLSSRFLDQLGLSSRQAADRFPKRGGFRDHRDRFERGGFRGNFRGGDRAERSDRSDRFSRDSFHDRRERFDRDGPRRDRFEHRSKSDDSDFQDDFRNNYREERNKRHYRSNDRSRY
ncbi:hypothetical protein EC973_002095 [Apophysomyces ossiformis]|uniref:ATP-dependent RNA helicase n=1 Tax=Apophysomyces ossiformis TaxID=679940 RepID=A0A8H7BL43_9FUNG|nr:hypothetical protein EC973_002095 [Apophysomyces ossiformis]